MIAVLGAGPARSATHLVPEGHSTIQGALAAAASGDTVSIAPGTYYEHDLVWPPGVLILGRASSPEQVVIDGQFQGQIVGGENLVGGSEIGFLTLRGGLGAGLYGSGLLASGEAFIHDITIEDCSASHAIYGIGLCSLGKITISDCTLRRNTSTAAGTHGGGAYLASTGLGLTFSISNLEVHENDAEHGAGVYVNGSQGTISGLYAHDNLGSGLSVYDGDWGTGPRVENSLFISNEGSGVTFDASLIMQSCTVVDNGPAGSWIGGISCGSTWDHPHNPSITQCIVFDNRGSGISWLDPTSF
ncbi:right-handed parallel beta-helix repeat-containing protein, partial [bacterium]|nr:right-handed parallel beta-helix repeat-containing protein [bacterium]